MKIIVAMAGAGTRVSDHYGVPKPLINVHGHPLVAWAISGLPFHLATEIIFIVNKVTNASINLLELVRPYVPINTKIRVHVLNVMTSGQGETVYLGINQLNLSEPILIFNCDTYISNDFKLEYLDSDGMLGTFESEDPQMSYVELINRKVVYVAEKVRISKLASTGLYYFKKKELYDFCYLGTKHEKESYIAPMYNILISKGYEVGQFRTSIVMPLGTSAEIAKFEKLDLTNFSDVKIRLY